ncbi:MAG: hypothetical protein ACPIOQ_44315 [Promethearchaeia archaeon]
MQGAPTRQVHCGVDTVWTLSTSSNHAAVQNGECALVVADYSPLQKGAPRASLRITTSAGHTQRQLEAMVKALASAASSVFAA